MKNLVKHYKTVENAWYKNQHRITYNGYVMEYQHIAPFRNKPCKLVYNAMTRYWQLILK